MSMIVHKNSCTVFFPSLCAPFFIQCDFAALPLNLNLTSFDQWNIGKYDASKASKSASPSHASLENTATTTMLMTCRSLLNDEKHVVMSTTTLDTSEVVLDQPNPAELPANCRDPSSHPKAELPTQQMLFFFKPHAY